MSLSEFQVSWARTFQTYFFMTPLFFHFLSGIFGHMSFVSPSSRGSILVSYGSLRTSSSDHRQFSNIDPNGIIFEFDGVHDPLSWNSPIEHHCLPISLANWCLPALLSVLASQCNYVFRTLWDICLRSLPSFCHTLLLSLWLRLQPPVPPAIPLLALWHGSHTSRRTEAAQRTLCPHNWWLPGALSSTWWPALSANPWMSSKTLVTLCTNGPSANFLRLFLWKSPGCSFRLPCSVLLHQPIQLSACHVKESHHEQSVCVSFGISFLYVGLFVSISVSTVLLFTWDNGRLTPAAMCGHDCWALHEQALPGGGFSPSHRWPPSDSCAFLHWSEFPFRSSMYWVWPNENPPHGSLEISTPHWTKWSFFQVPHLKRSWICLRSFSHVLHPDKPQNIKSSTWPPTKPMRTPLSTNLKQQGSHGHTHIFQNQLISKTPTLWETIPRLRPPSHSMPSWGEWLTLPVSPASQMSSVGITNDSPLYSLPCKKASDTSPFHTPNPRLADTANITCLEVLVIVGDASCRCSYWGSI